MTHDYSSTNDYLLQLPYLNDSGNAYVADIKWYCAQSLVEGGTHSILRADDGLYIITPIKPAVTNHVYQIGCEAV